MGFSTCSRKHWKQHKTLFSTRRFIVFETYSYSTLFTKLQSSLSNMYYYLSIVWKQKMLQLFLRSFINIWLQRWIWHRKKGFKHTICFVLYDFQNQTSHNKGQFKFLEIPSSTIHFLKRPNFVKTVTLDYPNNLYYSVF